MKEKTISRRIIYQGRILNLRIDRVKLPGGKISFREIVEHPGAVGIIPLLPDNRIVLVKQYRKPIEKITYEIPAGTLKGKEDIFSCAKRELAEETGYQAGQIKKVLTYYPSPGFCNEILHLFLACNLRKGKIKLDEDELVSVKIVSLKKAEEMIKKGQINDSKSVIALFWLKGGEK